MRMGEILSKGRDRKKRGPRPKWDNHVGFHHRIQTAMADSKNNLLKESGSMQGTGAIHISEINPTLAALEKVLGMDLRNNALGSVGKKEFSGDIDIALNLSGEEIPAFMEKLKTIPQIMDIAKSSVIMTKVQIANYDANKKTDKQRTGYVQVDFMLGNPAWLKTYYHAPHEKDSKYKGVHRTILLATIAAIHARKDSDETVEDGRPMTSIRYMFSPSDGLVKIKRVPEPKKSGVGHTKKNINTVIDGPWTDANEIAKILNLGSAADLDSFETLMAAVKKNYPQAVAQKVMQDYANNDKIKEIGVPDELKDFVS